MTWLDCGRCSLAVAMLSFLTASCFRPLPERTLEGPLPRAELGLRSTSYKVTEVAGRGQYTWERPTLPTTLPEIS